MNSVATSQTPNTVVRPVAYRDLEILEKRLTSAEDDQNTNDFEQNSKLVGQVRRWYGLIKLLSLFPNPYQHLFCSYIAEQEGQLRGNIQISPFNRTRSTWRVDRVWVDPTVSKNGIGSVLLRHCMEAIWEARTWLLEVNVNDKDGMALYRQNGFQPLAHTTYWEINPETIRELAERETDLPNLLPVSNADAQLLCQLDTAAMPPVVRQVFDRHIQDFQTNIVSALLESIKQWLTQTETVSAYVFEPQRKAAIGYFQLSLSRKGTQPHSAQLTVHPAYTWLYPELLSQMARIVGDLPPQSLELASCDYQPEREQYLEQIGAKRIYHTLLMSRSVWHKLRETRLSPLEALQLTEVLQGLGAARKPVPSRLSWLSGTPTPSTGEINPLATATPDPPNTPRTSLTVETNNPLPDTDNPPPNA
ncbi:GNAT family N-acetyltransferase [Ancylothrix sp. C2]|uniref:GNAT family N-acetyltransferase n=1 Tax=Ancylothrix sp. D3o TaxID=2953691 RepID=UPI0021BB833A|nr:GNAT family N-acetyltransferase [Ancylothrix sp. D3o]MCT7951832.1 GNAT family N-acetyltransferase [Ancylothrix sp. D3o]